MNFHEGKDFISPAFTTGAGIDTSLYIFEWMDTWLKWKKAKEV